MQVLNKYEATPPFLSAGACINRSWSTGCNAETRLLLLHRFHLVAAVFAPIQKRQSWLENTNTLGFMGSLPLRWSNTVVKLVLILQFHESRENVRGGIGVSCKQCHWYCRRCRISMEVSITFLKKIKFKCMNDALKGHFIEPHAQTQTFVWNRIQISNS